MVSIADRAAATPETPSPGHREGRWILLLVLPLLFFSAWTHAERHALLIGVGDYAGLVRPLAGPAHDVRSLYTALIGRWGFDPDKISVLLDGGGPLGVGEVRAGTATKDGILDALERLQRRTRPGDHIFIYFSGHGTSAKDRNVRWPLPYDTAALVPWGFNATGGSLAELARGLVVGRTEDPHDRDVRSLLSALDDPDPEQSRHLFVAVDACYSARAMRSLGVGQTRGTTLPFAQEPELSGYDLMLQDVAEDYPYHNVFILTASAEHQEALDLSGSNLRRFPTRDGLPHGAFTDTLLRILNGDLAAIETGRNGQISYGELFETLRAHMADRGYGHEPAYFPIMEQGGLELRSRGVFTDAKSLASGADATAPSAPKPAPPLAGTSIEPLRIALQIDDEALRQRLETATVDGVVLDARNPELQVQEHAARISLCTPGGEQVASLSGSERDRLLPALRHQGWTKQLRAHRHPRQGFAVSVDTAGSRQAGLAVGGELVAFVVGSEQAVYPVLINIDPAGLVTVLYPANHHELIPLEAGTPQRLPPPGHSPIVVRPPFGMDDIVLLGFTERIPLLDSLVGATIAPGDPRYPTVQQALLPTDPGIARALMRLKTQDRDSKDSTCRPWTGASSWRDRLNPFRPRTGHTGTHPSVSTHQEQPS